MTSTRQPSSSEAGSLLLLLSIILFVCSLAAAGVTWYLTNHPNALRPSAPTASATPAASIADLLNPVIIVDPALSAEQEQLQKDLVTPLRQHYATTTERLTQVTITPTDDEAHPLQVKLILRTSDSERELVFMYDGTKWTPNMLDNAVATPAP